MPRGQPSVARMSPSTRSRGRFGAMPHAQDRSALGGVEGQVRGRELAQPARGARLGNAELERPAAGDGDVQHRGLRPDQLAEQPQRPVGAVKMLAVVDHEYQRLHQQSRQLGQQFAGGREHVDLLRRGGQAFGQRVGGTGRDARDPVEDPEQQDPRALAR